MKHKGFLPVFPGFYGTMFEPCEENEIEYWSSETGKELDYDDLIFDYDEYQENAARGCCDFIEYKLNELGFSIKVEYEGIAFPNYYNFSNDSINCTYDFDKDEIRRITTYLLDNLDDFKGYLEGKYTSYDGFISWYSNKPLEWMEYLNTFPNDDNMHMLSSILEFILTNELGNDIMWSMFDSIPDNHLTASLKESE